MNHQSLHEKKSAASDAPSCERGQRDAMGETSAAPPEIVAEVATQVPRDALADGDEFQLATL